MYYFKLVLTLCACLLCAFCAASFMFHMANAGHPVIGFIAGLFYGVGLPAYLFHINEREHHGR